ncbi:MAG: cysteine methyltransferase [Zetaproteobacteria bacterium CG12_big_fil_rev_8_21_14_0_65_54_13]|nr:MAG: cysteine methyltransferase [Zetaproteobacteria bacterium CG23_combo_of_CG06-09_8_20_14_all_54_7]PIW51533.1 MAG: cysteine methyltransferase [Zetaproteobacteria bacterium CG12_big_fil_rev_8_21_14_0_65_54_13]PIX53611.1 MAG: cysteine methyltransferase [Zetaproteobacteria bacterium CG_4_10_14_3_um_filter_54_28]PJA27931.1 MAG: cysteine methyltransferase [Zetaproteobacteria bacterium CG_4_9_14_3_um_filter_54_145]
MVYRFDSPLGPIDYDWSGAICSSLQLTPDTEAVNTGNDPVAQWLHAYFEGRITPLPPLAAPATPFQQKMRAGLLAIPFGEVRSYGELATALGTAPRAMGQALGANPLPLLIPCHRVVAANGLGGFACGVAWKKKLLDFESGFSAPH